MVVTAPSEVPFNIFSAEQKILKELHEVGGKIPTTESRLQGGPRWLIDKCIYTSNENYKREESYREVKLQYLPLG